MRKIKSIFYLALLVSIFNACDNKEETVNYVQQNYLAGKWVFKQQGLMNAQTGIDFTDYLNFESCNKDNIVFNDDEAKSFVIHDYSLDGSCTETTISGNYEQVNHKVTLTYTIGDNDYREDYIITKLTNDEIEYNFNNGSQLIFMRAEKE